MATSYKSLGQLDLTTTALTDFTLVLLRTETVISTVIIANRNASADTFRLAIRVDGDAISNSITLLMMCRLRRTIRPR
jgi:hypothetical protein